MALESLRTQTSNVSEEFVTEALPVGWPWRLLVFSIVIFAFTAFAYLGLHFGYLNYLENTVKSLDQSLADLASSVGVEKQQKFVGIYSQLVNLKTVLDQHPYTSNALKFLEANVLPPVYFTEATVQAPESVLLLRGVTNSFDNLAAQVSVFQRATGVVGILLSNVSIQGGNIGFEVDVSFDPSYFLKPQ